MPVFTNSSTVAHELPAARPDQKVELVLAPHCEGTEAALKLSTWTDGLGWCTQKTICLTADQLDELHRAVTVARHRVNRRRADAGHQFEPAQVIQLPTLA